MLTNRKDKSLQVRGRGFGQVNRLGGSAFIAAFLLSSFAVLQCPAPDFKVPSFPNFFKGRANDDLQEVGRAPTGPGGLCQLSNGDYVISCHQFFGHQYRVMRKNREGWAPFPNLEMNTPGSGSPIELDSVLGIVSDGNVVWMLDNGRRTGKEPKLIAWDTKKDALHRIILLAPSVKKTSILKNLILDPSYPFAYVSDPADGVDSAIIVVDLNTGLSRRVLQGHVSVRRDPGVNIILDGKTVEARRADGKIATPLSGVSPFALDRRGDWLFYGPRNSNTLFRIETEFLRDANLAQSSLVAHVESFSPKPVCDSIVVDSKERIYFSDIGNSAVTYVSPDDDYKEIQALVKDPRMVWPGGLLFGTDGQLHFFCNQLNRAPIFNGGRNQTSSPYYLFKIRPLPTKRFKRLPDFQGKLPQPLKNQ